MVKLLQMAGLGPIIFGLWNLCGKNPAEILGREWDGGACVAGPVCCGVIRHTSIPTVWTAFFTVIIIHSSVTT